MKDVLNTCMAIHTKSNGFSYQSFVLKAALGFETVILCINVS